MLLHFYFLEGKTCSNRFLNMRTPFLGLHVELDMSGAWEDELLAEKDFSFPLIHGGEHQVWIFS